MGKFILRLIVNAIAMYAAVALLSGHGITPTPGANWLSYIWLALIFGVINALLRPLLMVLTCPLIILTLGFGTLIVNTILFYLAGTIGNSFGVRFTIDSLLAAFLGAIIVSIVSMLLNTLIKDESRR